MARKVMIIMVERTEKAKMHHKAFKALRILAILNLLMGVQYCWSVISPQCIELYGWTPTEAALPYTVLTVTNALSAIPLSRLGEKYGAGRIICLGGFSVGVGVFLCSLTNSLLGMIVCYGVITSFGLAAISMNTSSTAMKWFPQSKKGFAVGVATMCIGLSSVLMAPVINALLDNFGLSIGLKLLGIGAGVLICFFSIILPKLPKNMYEQSETRSEVKEEHSRYHNSIGPNQVFKTKEFWLILAIYALNWMPGQMIFSSVSTICQVQAGWEKGYIAVMAMSIGNGVGRLVSASLTDKFGGRKTMKVLMLIQIINLILFRFYIKPYMILPGIILLGCCVGAGIPLVYVLVSNIYGMKYVGSINALVQLGYAISGVIGPMIAARVLEISGTYMTAYLVNAMLLIFGVLCVGALKSKQRES